ncbi:Zinc finger, CCCH-type domain-containing protein [Strongyloides ratti]|uniref:Zinc finger, CCCH-type domain-containing protein n=1 Tax=Strongyloides ratti TaxID=34506 RepID=A0A090L0P8_STRRB|nr:Zinc finger, CCCH-type domain-containing protein [Strongyloides ratti]CEF63355.1 Zinc finger, CCCH-type domain-containing protein [Strongyloides ratti]
MNREPTRDKKDNKDKKDDTDGRFYIKDLGESVFTSLRELNLMSYNEATHFANLIVEKVKKKNVPKERNKNNEDNKPKSNRGGFYKTKLCEFYERKGVCRFRDRCYYAHGINELRKRAYSYYNTKSDKVCHYYKQGYCSKGLSCKYIHKADESDDEFYHSTSSFKRSKNYHYDFPSYGNNENCRFYHSYGPNAMPKPKNGSKAFKSSRTYFDREKAPENENKSSRGGNKGSRSESKSSRNESKSSKSKIKIKSEV